MFRSLEMKAAVCHDCGVGLSRIEARPCALFCNQARASMSPIFGGPMVEHDFRYTLMNPQHTLTECRALVPGRYQVTGNGGSIRNNDVLVVTLKGAKDLSMRLTVDTVRH